MISRKEIKWLASVINHRFAVAKVKNVKLTNKAISKTIEEFLTANTEVHVRGSR